MIQENHPTRSLRDFIKTVVDTRSKEEEDRLVLQNLEKIKQEIHGSGLSNGRKMEHTIKLIYSEMLGQNVQFGLFSVINQVESKRLEVKRLGYLAASLLLDQEPQFKILLGASINRDLRLQNKQAILSVLNSLPKLVTVETC
jgi:AP-4 complex subunit epsilon-1